MKQKPREFWIKDGDAHEVEHEDMKPYEYHVIEYSAYDNLKKQMAEVLNRIAVNEKDYGNVGTDKEFFKLEQVEAFARQALAKLEGVGDE